MLVHGKPVIHPCAILDDNWLNRDFEWEHAVVERLQREEAAPRSLSIDEFMPDPGLLLPNGWEQAEAYARNANRVGAAFLSDEAVARRKIEQERDQQAFAALEAQWRAERRAKAYGELEAPRGARQAKVRTKGAQRDAVRAAREVKAALAAAEARRVHEAELAAVEEQWEEAKAAKAKREARWAEEWEMIGHEKFIERRRIEMRLIMAKRWECNRCDTLVRLTKQCVDAEEAIYVFGWECGCGETVCYHDALLGLMRR